VEFINRLRRRSRPVETDWQAAQTLLQRSIETDEVFDPPVAGRFRDRRPHSHPWLRVISSGHHRQTGNQWLLVQLGGSGASWWEASEIDLFPGRAAAVTARTTGEGPWHTLKDAAVSYPRYMEPTHPSLSPTERWSNPSGWTVQIPVGWERHSTGDAGAFVPPGALGRHSERLDVFTPASGWRADFWKVSFSVGFDGLSQRVAAARARAGGSSLRPPPERA
jgi:hypothetical protein